MRDRCKIENAYRIIVQEFEVVKALTLEYDLKRLTRKKKIEGLELHLI